MNPKIKEKIGKGKKNHLINWAKYAYFCKNIYWTDNTIGTITPIKKYIILTISEPVSSFSKKNERKYINTGLANIINKNRY